MADIEASKFKEVPEQPTEAMLDAARDWSINKYGQGIGSDAARGCWKAMFDAAVITTDIYELYEQIVLKHKQALLVAQAALEYIDAIPKDVVFAKAMHGFDRDWADSVVAEK